MELPLYITHARNLLGGDGPNDWSAFPKSLDPPKFDVPGPYPITSLMIWLNMFAMITSPPMARIGSASRRTDVKTPSRKSSIHTGGCGPAGGEAAGAPSVMLIVVSENAPGPLASPAPTASSILATNERVP